MKLYVNICFHYVEERLQYLDKVINSIQKIPTKETLIIVNSNERFECEGVVYVAHGLKDPYHLTWEHKKYMVEFLKTDYTHYVYLEDDMEITKQTMDYWIETRQLFKENNANFLPAIHRIEYDNDGVPYSLDCTKKINFINLQKVMIGDQAFASLPEPYQGMFIMDRELVQEHMNTQSYYIGQNRGYGIRESANLGNMYENVPDGFSHRALVPLEKFERCWVHHNSNNYQANLNTPHAKIKVEELFNGN